MCIARHKDVLIFLALGDKFVKERLGLLYYVAQSRSGEELQIDEHLVISGASGVDFLSHIAELARQHELHLRVDILHSVLNDEVATVAYLIDIPEFVEQ